MTDWDTGRPRPKAATVAQRAKLVERAQVIVAEAVRWTSNILVEVVGNHARHMSVEQRAALKDATAALARFQQAPLPPEYEP